MHQNMICSIAPLQRWCELDHNSLLDKCLRSVCMPCDCPVVVVKVFVVVVVVVVVKVSDGGCGGLKLWFVDEF